MVAEVRVLRERVEKPSQIGNTEDTVKHIVLGEDTTTGKAAERPFEKPSPTSAAS